MASHFTGWLPCLAVLTIDIEYSFSATSLPLALEIDTILLDSDYEAFAEFSNVRNVSEFLDGSFVLQLANYKNTQQNIDVPLAEEIISVDASGSSFTSAVNKLFGTTRDAGSTSRSGSR